MIECPACGRDLWELAVTEEGVLLTVIGWIGNGMWYQSAEVPRGELLRCCPKCPGFAFEPDDPAFPLQELPSNAWAEPWMWVATDEAQMASKL